MSAGKAWWHSFNFTAHNTLRVPHLKNGPELLMPRFPILFYSVSFANLCRSCAPVTYWSKSPFIESVSPQETRFKKVHVVTLALQKKEVEQLRAFYKTWVTGLPEMPQLQNRGSHFSYWVSPSRLMKTSPKKTAHLGPVEKKILAKFVAKNATFQE